MSERREYNKPTDPQGEGELDRTPGAFEGPIQKVEAVPTRVIFADLWRSIPKKGVILVSSCVLAAGGLLAVNSCGDDGGQGSDGSTPAGATTSGGNSAPQGRQNIPESEQFPSLLNDVKRTNPKVPIFYNILRTSITDPNMESTLVGSKASWNFWTCHGPNNSAHPAGYGDAILISGNNIADDTKFQPLTNPTLAEISTLSKLRNEFLINWGDSLPKRLPTDDAIEVSVTGIMGNKIGGCDKPGENAPIAVQDEYETIFSSEAYSSEQESATRNSNNTGNMSVSLGDVAEVSAPIVGLALLIFAVGVTGAVRSRINRS